MPLSQSTNKQYSTSKKRFISLFLCLVGLSFYSTTQAEEKKEPETNSVKASVSPTRSTLPFIDQHNYSHLHTEEKIKPKAVSKTHLAKHSLPVIKIENSWVRAPRPGASVAAGYFHLTNKSNQNLILEKATCECTSSIEMHHYKQNSKGMLKMQRLPPLTIKPNETLSFTPGGKHLMLFNFCSKEEDRTAITFHFKKATSQTIIFSIRH